MAGKTKFITAGLLIVAAVAYLIVSSTGSTTRYFLTIEEIQTTGDENVDKNLTVSGAVLVTPSSTILPFALQRSVH